MNIPQPIIDFNIQHPFRSLVIFLYVFVQLIIFTNYIVKRLWRKIRRSDIPSKQKQQRDGKSSQNNPFLSTTGSSPTYSKVKHDGGVYLDLTK